MDTDSSWTLAASGTRFVRVVWCDNANIIRAKAIHTQMLREFLEHGVGITPGQQGVPVMFDAVIPETGLGPVGDIRLVMDAGTLTQLPYAPGHARVMGKMILDGQPWALCPRGFLQRMIREAEREGLQVQASFENEFYLLRGTSEDIVPADDTVFASTQAMDANRVVMDAIADALLAQGIPIELYYPESGPGQQELTVQYTQALPAADRQIAFRETAHAIASAHGLTASFLPKIFEDRAGSGCHLHLSLWREGHNLMPEAGAAGGLSREGRAFVAGLLAHLPALMALTVPSTNSYRRLKPHFWSGAFRCWGVDNREAAIRVPSHPKGLGSRHIELKTVDASSNPYLALGAIIAAGLAGVRRDLEPGSPLSVDPGYLSAEQRRAQGIEALPASLDQSIEHLSQDEVLLAALGPELARAYLAVRRAEWDALKGLDLAGEVKLLLERY
jgi:glutamine synthetase